MTTNHNPDWPFSADVTIQATDIVLGIDTRGRVVYFNDEALRAFGYPGEELAGLSIEELCPVRDAGPDRSRFDIKRIVAGRDFTGGFRCPRKDGSQLALYMYATAGRDKAGKAVGAVCVAREVTRFWQAEEAARASEEKYRLLFDASPDLALLITAAGLVAHANRAVTDLTGIPPDRLAGKAIAELVPPGSRQAIEALLTAIRRKRQLRQVVEIITASGQPAQVELNASVVRDRGQDMILAIGRDVTRRVLAERAMKTSEEKYRTIFSTARDGMFLETIDGRILDANEAAARMLGYTRSELKRKKVSDLVPEDGRKWLPGIAEQLLTTGSFQGEAVNLRKDGTEVPVDLACTLVDLGTGPMVLAVARDITERKQAERALAESEENFRSLADNAYDGILIATGPGKHVYANRRAAEITGYTAEELLSTDMATLAHPDELPALRDRYTRRMAGEEVSSQYETRILDKRGRPVPIELTASRTAWHGEGADLVIIRDITERRQAEQQLQEERNRARRYLDVAGAMIVALDECGGVTLANRQACRVLGRTEDELVGRDWFDTCLPPENREQVKGVYRRLMTGDVELVRQYENEVLVRDGGRRMIEWTNTVLVDDQGRIVGTLSSGSDVTERRGAEAMLRDREARLRLLVEQFPAVIWTTDAELRFTSSAGAGLETLGLKPGEVVGMPLTRYFGTDDDEYLPILAHRRALTGEAARYDFEWSNTIFEVVVEPLRDPQGVVIGTIGLARDVSERNRAEAALRESEQRFRALFELSPDGVAVHQDGKVVTANPAGARILGYDTPEDMEGLPVLELVHPDDREAVIARIRNVMQGGAPGGVREERFRRKDGSWVWVEVVNAAFDWEGRPAVQVVVRDISQRKRDEERMDILLQSVPQAVLYQTGGGVEYVSPNVEQMLGYTAEEIAGDRGLFPELIHPDDRPDMEAAFSAWLKSGAHGVHAAEFRAKRKDGEWVWLRDQARLAFIAPDGKRSTLGVLVDITEHRRAEQELRDREERLRSLQENVPVGLFRTTPAGAFQSVNPAAVRMLGFGSEAEMLATSVADVYADPSQRAVLLKQLGVTGRLEGVEAELRRRDGTTFPAVLNVRAQPGPDGKPAYFDGTVEDITERRRSEAALRESEEKFRTVVERANDGICIVQDGIIKYVNQRVADVSDFPVEELVGRPFAGFLEPEERTRLAERYRRRMAGEDVPAVYDASFPHRDGSTVAVEINAGVIQYEGRPADLIILRDITERKESERVLRESRERYSTLFMGVPVGIYRTAPDGRILLANPALVKMLGYESVDALRKMNLEQSGYPPGYAREDFRRRIEADGRIDGLEIEWTRADGVAISVRENARVVRDAQGKVMYYEGTVEDITGQKLSDALIRESETRYRRLVEASPDGIAVYQDGVLRMANEAAASLLGYGGPHELVGKSAADLVHPDDRARVAERETLLASDPGADQAAGPLHVRMRRRDGSYIPVDVVGAATSWDDRPAIQVTVRASSSLPAH